MRVQGRSRRRFLAALPLAAVAFCGCGYRLAGTGAPVLPEHIRKIVVLPFENRTTRTEIEQRVTEEVARELSRRGRYEVVTDRTVADAMLEGAVTSYRTSPVAFGPQSTLATRTEAVVTLQATLRELATDEVLWSQDGLVFREQFDVESTDEFFDEESGALDEIARGAAGALITAMVEGF